MRVILTSRNTPAWRSGSLAGCSSLQSLVRDLPPLYEAFYADTAARTCPECGELHPGKEPPDGWVDL